MERSELAGYSEMAAQHLTSLRTRQPVDSVLGTPILQRKSLDNHIPSSAGPASNIQTTSDSPSAAPHHPILRYHKAAQHQKTKSRMVIKAPGDIVTPGPVEHTPPSSDDSDSGQLPSRMQFSSFGKNHKQLSVNSMLAQPQEVLNTPDSPTFGSSPPNFSPMRSTALPGCELPYQIDPKMLSERTHGAMKYGRGVLLNKSSVTSPPSMDQLPKSRSHRDLPKIKTTSANTGSLDSIHKSYGTGQDDRTTVNSSTTKVSSGDSMHTDPTAEAKFAAEFWAKNLGFDTIYAVELIPKKLFMNDTELTTPGGVETRLLLSYGLQEPVNFDIRMHLNVLRGSGGMTWENNFGMPAEYSRGFMMPLNFAFGMLDYRSAGVVFGAFRKTPQDAQDQTKLSAADIDRLRQAARVLRNILQKSASSRRPSCTQTELPPSPTPKAHHSSHSADMGKTSSLPADMENLVVRNRPARIQFRQL
jgi:hypothetical protein